MLRYAISDRRLLAPDETRQALEETGPAREQTLQAAALVRQVQHLARIGVDYFQLREKDLQLQHLLALARDLQAAITATPSSLRLLINVANASPANRSLTISSHTETPLSVALNSGAAGLHLPGGWTAAALTRARSAFRQVRSADPILSVTAHTLAELEQAREAGASLILFGPVFEKRVRGELISAGTGLAQLARAAALAGPVPVLALGGVTHENTPACLAAGAAGVSGIRLFGALPQGPS